LPARRDRRPARPDPRPGGRSARRGARTLADARIPARRAAPPASRQRSARPEPLRLQAAALRRDARRRLEERAARAAPKIQLVVALVLVPSVLLTIAAGLIANAGTLLQGF